MVLRPGPAFFHGGILPALLGSAPAASFFATPNLHRIVHCVRAILSNPSIPSAASPSASPSPSAEGEGRRRRGRQSSFITTSGCGHRRSQSRACNSNLLLLQLLLLSQTLLLSSSLLALPLLQRLCFGRLQLFFSPASRASWTDLSPSASPQPHLTTDPPPQTAVSIFSLETVLLELLLLLFCRSRRCSALFHSHLRCHLPAGIIRCRRCC